MSSTKVAIHLVGSVPLSNAREVMEVCSATLGDHAARLPDGETGERSRWIRFQERMFEEHPAFEPTDLVSHSRSAVTPNFRMKPGTNLDELRFPNLGYADNAILSYETFSELKSAGQISPYTRFMVALPTAVPLVWAFVVPDQRGLVHAIIEECLRHEIRRICDAIPHAELSIQWDVFHEILMLEGVRESFFEDTRPELLSAAARSGSCVPADVQLGYHLCYGDGNQMHTIEPADLGLLVEVMNSLSEGVTRQIDYIHVPVPRERDDNAYFTPLERLHLRAGTLLYLGLVHDTDGVPGSVKRATTARTFVDDFGIATECGMGRRPPETIRSLLDVHVRTAEAIEEL